MLISHSKKFVFVHIYKTAGTSISDLFLPYSRLKDRLVFQFKPTRKFVSLVIRLMKWHDDGQQQFTGVHKHAPAIDIKNYMGATKYDDYYKFIFVRNPYDLMVSLYFYIRQAKVHRDHERVNTMEFDEFVKWEIERNPPLQWDFLTDPDSGEIIVNYIGYFETIKDDISFLKTKFALGEAGSIQHKNPSNKRSKKDYRTYYTEDSKNRVEQYFKKDLENLGYSFEGITQKRVID